MVDYAGWASADILTVEQAAFLWVGIDPCEPFETLPREVRAAIAPRLQMLQGAIAAGDLTADSRTNALAASGNFAASLVQRSDLMTFAEGRGERPAFLFPPSRMHPAPRLPGTVLLSELPWVSKDSKLLRDAERFAQEKIDATEEAMRLAETRADLKRQALASPSVKPQRAQPPPLHLRRVTGPQLESDSNPPVRPASAATVPERRAAGRKPNLIEAVRAWIAEKYPGGVPSRRSLSALVAELKADKIDVSEKTISRALKAR